jgi:hypothetical protein
MKHCNVILLLLLLIANALKCYLNKLITVGKLESNIVSSNSRITIFFKVNLVAPINSTSIKVSNPNTYLVVDNCCTTRRYQLKNKRMNGDNLILVNKY